MERCIQEKKNSWKEKGKNVKKRRKKREEKNVKKRDRTNKTRMSWKV